MNRKEAAARRPLSSRTAGRGARAVLGIVLAMGGLAVAMDQAPARDWRDGPVRFLLTPDEYRRYGRLETDDARAAFVTRFWARLDADPKTPGNEFRERFESRCALADRRFSDFPGTGWKTDRGRVLILLGEPDAVEKMTGDADSLDREVWTYGLAGQGAGPLRIVFYRGKDGRYRLNPRPVERSAGSAGAIPDRDRESARAQLRFSLPPMTRMAQSVVLDALMGVEPRGGSSVPRSRGRVADSGAANGPSAPPPPRSAIVADGAWYFQAADGSVLALLVVDVIASELVPGDRDLSAIAYLLDADGESNAPGAGGEEIRLTEADAHAGPGVRRFVGRVYLEPGDVRRVRYAFADDERQTMVVRTRRLHAPELGTGGLAVSSIVPSDDFGPLPPGPPTPFAVGSEVVRPRPDVSWRRGEPLRVYFQVYGASPGPEDGRLRLDIRFRFERAGTRGWRRHGKPLVVRGAVGESMGLVLPIGDWPLGDYRVGVEVIDRVAGREAEGWVAFRVVE